MEHQGSEQTNVEAALPHAFAWLATHVSGHALEPWKEEPEAVCRHVEAAIRQGEAHVLTRLDMFEDGQKPAGQPRDLDH